MNPSDLVLIRSPFHMGTCMGDVVERPLLQVVDQSLARLCADRAEYDVHLFQTEAFGFGYQAAGMVSAFILDGRETTHREKTAIPPILIAANIIKSLYPKLASIVGVTLATTKSRERETNGYRETNNRKRDVRLTPQPLRPRSDSEPIMPCTRRKNVRDVHPWKRSPPHRVEAYIDIQHRGHRLGRRRRSGCGRHNRVRFKDCANDKERDAHAHGRYEERGLASQTVDHEEHE